MADEDALKQLRQRMDEVRSRHVADRAGAARAFWRSLSPTSRGGCDGPALDSSAGHHQTGTAVAPGEGPGAIPGRRRGARGVRKGGAWVRGSVEPQGRGLWGHVPPPVPAIGDGRPGDGVTVMRPRELPWADAAGGDDALAAAEDDARWADVEAPEPTVDPTAVKIDAVAGRELSRHPERDVQTAAEQVAALRGQHDVMLVNLLAELETRGVACPGGLSRTDWLRSLDPGLGAGQAKAFVTVARAIARPEWADLAARLTLQHVSVAKAAVIVEFHDRTAPVADADELAAAIEDLVEQAGTVTPEALARLARHHGEQIRPPRDEDRLDAGRQAARGLWFAPANATGMVAMRGVLDPEAAAIIRSAIDPLSAPCPRKDAHGRTLEPDPRSPARRRADALLDLVGRGVASADHVPTTDKAKLVVTIDHEVLSGRVPGSGLAMSGEVLSPATVRRLACDAALVPMVLGGASEPLDVGRERRLVTKGLRLALWQRDGGCSFPRCTIPASWCDAHHVVPWFLGGQTKLTSMALLCRRHHTHVHQRELTATVTATHVTWHE